MELGPVWSGLAVVEFLFFSRVVTWLWTLET